jgi:hypothetical protein
MARISAELLVKKYRTYEYSATRPLGNLVVKRLRERQPPEWINPRTSAPG